MPELPEVDHARATLTRWLSGQRVTAVRVSRGRPVETSAARLSLALGGAVARRAQRRGKHLLIPFDGVEPGAALHVHLGMTGRIVVQPVGTPRVPHARLTLVTEDGLSVCLRDPRRFGRVRLVTARRIGELPDVAALGPDPVLDGLPGERLARALAGTRRAVKDVLLDQRRLAGIGNIYAAEALWRARVHPARPADGVTRREVARLARALLEVLTESLARFRVEERRRIRRLLAGAADAYVGPLYLTEGSGEDTFDVYGRATAPCRRCGTELESLVIAGRTSAFCPRCQA